MEVINEVYAEITKGITLTDNKVIISDKILDVDNFNFDDSKISILCHQGSLVTIDDYLNEFDKIDMEEEKKSGYFINKKIV